MLSKIEKKVQILFTKIRLEVSFIFFFQKMTPLFPAPPSSYSISLSFFNLPRYGCLQQLTLLQTTSKNSFTRKITKNNSTPFLLHPAYSVNLSSLFNFASLLCKLNCKKISSFPLKPPFYAAVSNPLWVNGRGDWICF